MFHSIIASGLSMNKSLFGNTMNFKAAQLLIKV